MDVVITQQPGFFSSERVSRYQIVKRLLDLFICMLLLPFLVPVMLCCAVLIRLDSPGPAFFIQDRIGKDGKIFKIYKFRTMRHNLDDSSHRMFMKAFIGGKIGSEVKDAASGLGAQSNEAAQKSALKDPFSKSEQKGEGHKLFKPFQASEVTRIGHVLRKHSLDELPQILNVFKGEMSVIGPRPNVPWEVEAYQSWHYERLEVLPGITGLAQVRGRSSISFDRIVQYDIEYVRNQSLGMDLKILWQTVSPVLLGDGAG